jgi:spoIIIJ-associated protein
MSVREFEGKNEEEAINRAIESLGLNRDEIDVEIVEAKKAPFLFGGGKVRIRVHLEEEHASEPSEPRGPLLPEGEFERAMVQYLQGLVERMGLKNQVKIAFREPRKLGLDVETEDSAILIGRKGQTLEAIQVIANVAAGRLKDEAMRIIVDTQDYRSRREKSLIRMAQQAAEQVRRTRQSRLLEAMNPFERRLVHTALSEEGDIETASEGEGLYKRIRVQYRGNKS